MIIYVNYNKETDNVTVSSDIEDIAPIELNSNTLINNSESLSFEIAVDTTSYEQINSFDEPFIELEQPE
mgnify:CR=1 FL=1